MKASKIARQNAARRIRAAIDAGEDLLSPSVAGRIASESAHPLAEVRKMLEWARRPDP